MLSLFETVTGATSGDPDIPREALNQSHRKSTSARVLADILLLVG